MHNIQLRYFFKTTMKLNFSLLVFGTFVSFSEGTVTIQVPSAGNCGYDTVLTCQFTGSIGYTGWFGLNRDLVANGGAVRPEDNNKYTETRGTSSFTLTIHNTDITDEGYYRCQNGFDESLLKRLHIECTATIQVPSAGNCGYDTVLTCHVTGSIGTTSWFGLNRNLMINGVAVRPEDNNKYTETRGTSSFTLTIHNTDITDRGDYKCQNGFDESQLKRLNIESPTKPTSPTTTPTTTKATTSTTTPTTTKTTTTISTTTTAKAVLNTVTCETCLSENCTRSTLSKCMAGEEYCLNTIIQLGNGSSTLSKTCASELECYYDAYIATKHNSGCGSSSSKTACHYCCKPTPGSTTSCNTDPVPKNLVDFGGNSGNTGTLCEVGRDGNYNLTTCSGNNPQCMNTVVLQTNLTVIKKTCESDILCNEDWWKLTRARQGCMKTSLSNSDAGLVCHYCCKSTSGSACNKEMIPDDVKDIISRVDGNWSKWLSWSNGCTADCKGVRVRVRSCSEPTPGPNGRDCQGSSFEQEDCGPMNCQSLGSGSQAIIG